MGNLRLVQRPQDLGRGSALGRKKSRWHGDSKQVGKIQVMSVLVGPGQGSEFSFQCKDSIGGEIYAGE